MHAVPQSTTVAVVGAGPSGLAGARKLIEAGFDVTVFERRSGPGGVWLYSSSSPTKTEIPTSHLHGRSTQCNACTDESTAANDFSRTLQYPGPCYQSLMTNVKTPLMQFDTFVYPEQTPWFVPHHVILRYLEGFSKHAGVEGVTRYNTNVVRVEDAGGGKWKLFTQCLRHEDSAPQQSSHNLEHIFDKVVVCTGHFDSSYVPPIPGLSEWYSMWPKNFLHSKEYRNNAFFKGKTVLLIGAGSSAYDIGREVALVASKVYQIVRRKSSGPWSQAVNSIVPENMITMPEIATFGSIKGIHDIRSGNVVLKDGRTLNGIDAIIFCTGYRFALPFLSDYQANERGKISIDRHIIITDGIRLHNLYKDMFFIPQPTLAFIGVPFATFPFLELQADTITAVFTGKVALPDEEDMYAAYTNNLSKLKDGVELYMRGVDGELDYVRETQNWSNNPSDQLKLRQYEGALKDAEKAFPEALARYLRTTRILQTRSADEIESIITSKVEEFKLAVARRN